VRQRQDRERSDDLRGNDPKKELKRFAAALPRPRAPNLGEPFRQRYAAISIVA
jgi:hypothetical protein